MVADVEARIREVGGLPKVEPLQEIAGRLVKSGKASDDGLEKMARGETVRNSVYGRAVEPQPSMALVKRSPKRTAN